MNILSAPQTALPFKRLPEGYRAYLVGGTVRDIFMSRMPTDYDIAVDGNPEDFARKLAAENKGRVVILGKPGLLLFRVVIRGHLVDITGLSGGAIEADLGERDFTINAMALELASGKVIDLFGGRRDIEDRVVRMVSPTAFIHDPVRLIRAYRMAAVFSFALSSETADAIVTHARWIRTSAAERIRDELSKILECGASLGVVRQMEQVGLLGAVFPELSEPLQKHQLPYNAYEELELTLRTPELRFPERADKIRRDMGKPEIGLLKCCSLFQGAGPVTDTAGDMASCEEAEKRADMAWGIASRLKFSNYRKQFVETVVRYAPLTSRLCRGKLTPREHMQFYTRFDAFVPAMLLLEASMNKNAAAEIEDLFQEFYGYYRTISRTPPLISGRDLIRDLGLDPSPVFKQILTTIAEERFLGNLDTREDALEFARQWLADNRE